MSKCWLLIIKESCSNPHSRTWIFLDLHSLGETIVVIKLFRNSRLTVRRWVGFMGGLVDPGGGDRSLDLTR